jgi:hypothetical protein
MQRYTVYLYVETALHVSGGISTNHQERIQLYLQHLVFVMVWQIPNAVDVVVCSPDDGRKYHAKHVEKFPDINKLCNVASCWTYIGILLGALPILHISMIKVKHQSMETYRKKRVQCKGCPKAKIKRIYFQNFLLLNLNFLPATASLQNNKFSRTCVETVKMAWYGNVRFKQMTVTEFLVAEKNK